MENFLVNKEQVSLDNWNNITMLYSLELGFPGRFHKMSIFSYSVKVSTADILRRTQFQAHLITEDPGEHRLSRVGVEPLSKRVRRFQRVSFFSLRSLSQSLHRRIAREASGHLINRCILSFFPFRVGICFM
jgi:hypothetical protein